MRKRIREVARIGWTGAAVLLVVLAAAEAGDASPNEAPPVAYTIDVALDAERMQLRGSETLRYTNRSPDSIPDLWFHLYLNAFRNEESTFMRESRGHLRRDEMPADGWGWIDIHRLTIAGADRTRDLTYIQPDGTDPGDRTVARVPLVSPLGPGETIEVAFEFEAQLPRSSREPGIAATTFSPASGSRRSGSGRASDAGMPLRLAGTVTSSTPRANSTRTSVATTSA